MLRTSQLALARLPTGGRHGPQAAPLRDAGDDRAVVLHIFDPCGGAHSPVELVKGRCRSEPRGGSRRRHSALPAHLIPPLGFTALASEIKWSPNSIFGPCYGLFADSALSQPDGWWEWQTPPLALGADSSYHYALHPRESGGDIVVKMMFGGGAGCASTPATICLSMVKFVEASGQTTYAEILGGATVLGGDGDCSLAMQSVTPTVVEAGEATTFSILGGGFSEGASVRLVGAQETRGATSLVVESPGRMQATFDTRSMVGNAELVVVSETGDSLSTTTSILSGESGAAYDSRTVILWTRPARLTLPPGEVGSALAYASAPPAVLAQLEMLGVVGVRSCAPAFLEDPAAAAELADPALLDIFVLDLADTNVLAACEVLAADTANVRASHPNWILTAMDVVPWDQLMPKSWHLRNTGSFPPGAGAVPGADSRAARAWGLSTGAAPVKVGVIDTGSWINHPDLAGRYFNAWKSVYTTTDNDYYGHGAPVAGIIAATGNGGGRAVGVNWSAEVFSLKAGTDNGEYLFDDVIQALTYAQAHQIKFVNMSFGGPHGGGQTDHGTLEEAVFNAFHAGMFLTASSGNGVPYGPTPSYPADIYPYVVSVGASLWTGRRWVDDDIPWGVWGYVETPPDPWPGSFSVWGNHLRFLAPGGRFVPSILGSTGYAEPDPLLLWMPANSSNHSKLDFDSPWWGFGGTSAAAPVVTGAAALIRSVAGDSLGAEEIAHLLAMTARQVDPEGPRYTPQEGWGIIDIEQALRAVPPGVRIERGVAVGGVVIDTAAGPVVDLIEFPGLPSPLYQCSSSAYNLRRRVEFAAPFAGRPLVLKRTHGSNGALTIPVQIRGTLLGPFGSAPTIPRWEPSIDTLAAYPDSCVLTTRVWRLYKNGQGYWWPCAPEDARFAYTLVGIPMSALAVEEGEPDPRQVRFAAGPSPTRGGIHVNFAASRGTTVQFDLIDVQGRRARDLGRHTVDSGALRLDLRLNDNGPQLRSGLYFLRATTPSTAISQRVVIVR